MNLRKRITNNLIVAFPYILLFISIVKVLSFLADYQVVWAHPENNVKREIILAGDEQTISSTILQTFNWPVIEAGAPRLTRLLSSFLDVTDAVFRNWFHAKVFPHPSISVSWIFMLALSPYFIFKIFHYSGLCRQASILGVSIYLSLAGPLSLITMNFRAGKSAALFFIIYIIYLMTRKSNETIEHLKNNLKVSIYILLIYFISLFTDEIAVFSLAAIFILQNYRTKSDIILPISATIISVLYYILVKYLLPALHEMAGFPVTCAGHCLEGEYDMLNKFISIITLKYDINYYFELLSLTLLNTLYGIRDLTGLSLLWSIEIYEKALGLATLIALCIVIVLYSLKFVSKSKTWLVNDSKSNRRIFSYALLLISAFLMHGVLMSLTRHPLWGIYWYGVFVSVPFLLLVTHVIVNIATNKPSFNLIIYSAITLLVTSNFITYASTNYAYKDYHYYPMRARQLPDVFTFRENKFELYQTHNNRYNLHKITSEFLQLRNGRYKITLPAELKYLTTEIDICPWEFDYYFILDKGATHFSTTCYSTILPELRLSLLQQTQSLKNHNTNISKMIGLYDADGYDEKRRKAYLSMDEDGKTFVVNGYGGYADIEINDFSIYSSTWKLRGTYNPNNNSIFWENGSVWIKNNELPDFQ